MRTLKGDDKVAPPRPYRRAWSTALCRRQLVSSVVGLRLKDVALSLIHRSAYSTSYIMSIQLRKPVWKMSSTHNLEYLGPCFLCTWTRQWYFFRFPGYKELYEDLHEVAPKWQTFGVHLKVPLSKIKVISGGDGMVESCFTSVLDSWLSGEGDCSIDQLVSALQIPGVDQRRLAMEIDGNRAGKWSYFQLLKYKPPPPPPHTHPC